MKRFFLFALFALTTLSFVSCVDEDDFIQEGDLQVVFSYDTNIPANQEVVISVLDVRGTVSLVTREVKSYGTNPILIEGLNVGTYRVKLTSASKNDLKDAEIRKGQTTTVKF